MSAVSSRRVRTVVALAFLTTLALTSCGGSSEYSSSETGRWLRIAGKFDETPEEIECVETAMHDLLSEAELRQWLSQDPETITVEQVQSLPHALEIADRCR